MACSACIFFPPISAICYLSLPSLYHPCLTLSSVHTVQAFSGPLRPCCLHSWPSALLNVAGWQVRFLWPLSYRWLSCCSISIRGGCSSAIASAWTFYPLPCFSLHWVCNRYRHG